jgi:hypothetical protein
MTASIDEANPPEAHKNGDNIQVDYQENDIVIS